jgi:betaine-aldehyde dehydrogenase
LIKKDVIMRRYRLNIAGEEVAGDRPSLPAVNPATLEVIAELDVPSNEQIDRALAVAAGTQESWRAKPAEKRGAVLLEAARLLWERADQFGDAEVADAGLPVKSVKPDLINTYASLLQYYGKATVALDGATYSAGAYFGYSTRDPIGVCCGIGAWNYPLWAMLAKAAPALACGNAFIAKPSEHGGLTPIMLQSLLRDAGLPDGLYTALPGDRDVGERLVSHPLVRQVSLTGSTATGKRIAAACGLQLKRFSAELGGKSPLAVLADANIDEAADIAAFANYFGQGQGCTSGTRVFVERSIYERFVEAVIERATRLRIGNPTDPATDIGPIINRSQGERIAGFVEGARNDGAEILVGGEQVLVNGLRGFFYRPTVIGRNRADMRHIREEIFGPVMSVIPFDTDEELIAGANDTEYGLSASVITNDLKRATRYVDNVKAGMIWINTHHDTMIGMPFGGVKMSGYGREFSLDTLHDYTEQKTVIHKKW